MEENGNGNGVGHIPFFRFFFGKHRDLFVALTIMTVCGLMFPTAIVEAFYSMNDTILFISLVILCTACLLHFVHFFLTATRTCTVCTPESFSYRIEDVRYDPISFLVAAMIFVGDFIFLMFRLFIFSAIIACGLSLVVTCGLCVDPILTMTVLPTAWDPTSCCNVKAGGTTSR